MRLFGYIILCCVLLAGADAVSARKLKYRVDEKAIKEAERLRREYASADSVHKVYGDEAEACVRLFGYDKPHNARRESLFVTNESDSCEVTAMTIVVRYMSLGGDALHSRRLRQECNVMPGATSRIQFDSWDETRTFYYYRTPPQRKRGLTPYTVSVRVEEVELRDTCRLSRD